MMAATFLMNVGIVTRLFALRANGPKSLASATVAISSPLPTVKGLKKMEFGLPADQVANNSNINTAPAPYKPTKAAANAIGEKLAAELEVFDRVAKEVKQKMSTSAPCEQRRKQVVEIAAELFGVAPTWVAFFREVMAREGVIATLFSNADERREYEASEEHAQILEMLTTLRSRDLPENDPSESQRMITVRIPKCVHDYICDEANALQVSVNKLCISRLLQRSDSSMIPTSQQRRRGRKPGQSQSSTVTLTTVERPSAPAPSNEGPSY